VCVCTCPTKPELQTPFKNCMWNEGWLLSTNYEAVKKCMHAYSKAKMVKKL